MTITGGRMSGRTTKLLDAVQSSDPLDAVCVLCVTKREAVRVEHLLKERAETDGQLQRRIDTGAVVVRTVSEWGSAKYRMPRRLYVDNGELILDALERSLSREERLSKLLDYPIRESTWDLQ